MKDWSWATHQPLIQMVRKLHNPTQVLESGIGLYSTPLLKDIPDYLGIENDPEWILTVKGEYPKLNILYHDLGDIQKADRYRNLNTLQKSKIFLFYLRLRITPSENNLLFVDGYACTRSALMNFFKSKFDLIIFHDVNPGAYQSAYEYNRVNNYGFSVYFLKSGSSWTGFMVKKEKDKGFYLYQDTLQPFIKEFEENWQLKTSSMSLIQIK
jgi:hypothetical protein